MFATSQHKPLPLALSSALFRHRLTLKLKLESWRYFGVKLKRTVEDLISDELAELVTGIPGTKFDDLTDEYLQAKQEARSLLYHKIRTESQIQAGKGLGEG